MNFNRACVATLAGLLAAGSASSTTPWVPHDVREELSIYEDIVQARIVEEDGRADSSAPELGACATTYAVAATTRVLKGKRRTGEKILLGGLPTIHANFPMKRGDEYVLFLQRDLSKDDEDMDYFRRECPHSSLVARTAGQERPFAGVYLGYHDFAIKTVDGQTSVAVWGYKGKTGWLFLEKYSFASTAADPARGGTLFMTPYEDFVQHLQRN